jgi:hypothetical protein
MEINVAVSDSEMVAARNTVLKLSKVGPGQIVTILTNPTSHPQTLQPPSLLPRLSAPSSTGSTCGR